MYIYIYPCRYRLWLYHIVIYGNPIWWKSHEIPISWEYASQLIAMELTRTSAAVTNWTPQGEIRCRNSDDSRFHVFVLSFFCECTRTVFCSSTVLVLPIRCSTFSNGPSSFARMWNISLHSINFHQALPEQKCQSLLANIFWSGFMVTFRWSQRKQT